MLGGGIDKKNMNEKNKQTKTDVPFWITIQRKDFKDKPCQINTVPEPGCGNV